MKPTSTQAFLSIEDIRDDALILNDGSMAIILQTSAVNFDLLSENEQLAIIGSFAAMLNSLSFPIQILIRSKRLDISNYLHTLKDAEALQNNPLLKLMMQHYRQFVTNIIKNNEVLDKQFFVIITVSYLEMGVVKNVEKNFEKGLTLLMPRRDHIMRQLGRIGLKSTQVTTQKLLELFYDEYNDTFKSSIKGMDPEELAQLNKKAQTPPSPVHSPSPQPTPPQPPIQQPQAPLPAVAAQPIQPPSQPPSQVVQQPVQSAPVQTNQPITQTPQPPPQSAPPTPRPVQPIVTQPLTLNRQAPFIVEELPDDYGTV